MTPRDDNRAVRVKVDAANPGQFFACCGLLELANRLWEGAEGGFIDGEFVVTPFGNHKASIELLLGAILDSELSAIEPDEPTTSPLLLEGRFNLRVDWWRDEGGGGARFKTWAGQQKVVTIAGAMHQSLRRANKFAHDLLNFGEVLPDPDDPNKSVAPFYFDARRAGSAHNLDVGFSSDVHRIDTVSFPAVEFLCLVGLQRFRAKAGQAGKFTYQTWPAQSALEPSLAAAVACGAVRPVGCQSYSFHFLYRTKYLKGFLPAILDRGDQ